MARLIPPYIHESVKSTGEKQIFELFKNDPETKGWIVLHSLGLTQHIKRMYGEIDFVVLAPKMGIFCLEVKSGDVERKDGVWIFTNRYGNKTTKTVGPFQQAQEGMFSLKEAIKRKFGERSRLSKILLGYGVMFPHINFDDDSPEYNQWQVYDRDSRQYPISQYIKRLSKNNILKMQKSTSFSPEEWLPTVRDIEELVVFLRGDFEKIVPLKQKTSDIEKQINEYTAEQCVCLDQMAYNQRCLFQGAAGTGKTMIAMESARRELYKRKRVLFLCFNSLLGVWLSNQFSSQHSEDIYVGSFHNFLEKICSTLPEFRNLRETYDDSEYFKYILPLLALEQIDKGIIEPFDKIIIDEAQDLLCPEYLDVINSLLKGGIAGGEWGIYCDFEKQAIYSDYSPKEMLNMLEERSSFTKFKLTVNCRNTRPIGEETSLISGFEVPPFLPGKVEGAPVEYFFYQNNLEQKEMIEQIISNLKKQKIDADNITILSPYRLQRSVASTLSMPVTDLNVNNLLLSKESRISFSTIQRYKGLENSYIILTDIHRLIDNEDLNRLLYVGMSRAKVGLYVIMDKRTKSEFTKLLRRGQL
jgi:Holliday junction resolvase-like predicted endonuclease